MAEQEYFWSDEWQAKIQRSQKAIQEGKFQVFDSVDDLLKQLGQNKGELQQPSLPPTNK